nr:MAG TPA: hypothetical protein [Caudoviricetes sp.]
MPAPLAGKTPSGRREMALQATEGGWPLAGRATAPECLDISERKREGPVTEGRLSNDSRKGDRDGGRAAAKQQL